MGHCRVTPRSLLAMFLMFARQVSKKGPNTGREFWCCGRGEGKAGDPLARCDFFKWIK